MNTTRSLAARCAALIVLAIFALAAICYLTGCATTRPSGRETAALSRDLDTAETANTSARNDVVFLRKNLSRADGKAAVILEWFREHRGEPQH